MLRNVISNYASGTYAITRRAVATYDDNGYLESTVDTVVNLELSLQPVTGHDLQVLPEGLRPDDLIKVWSRDRLYTQTETNNADSFEHDGETWVVIRVKTWGSFKTFSGGSHWECIAAKSATL